MIFLSWTDSLVKTAREARLSRMMTILVVLSGLSLQIGLIYKD